MENIIGNNIRAKRRARGLTQKELGERAGIAEPTIRRYELGKLNPKMETIEKIAVALNVPPKELLEGTSWGESSLWGEWAARDTMEKFYDEKEWIAEQLDMKTGEKVRTPVKNPLYEKMEEVFFKLNLEGKREAIKRIEKMAKLPEYQRQSEAKVSETPSGSADDKESKAK